MEHPLNELADALAEAAGGVLTPWVPSYAQPAWTWLQSSSHLAE